MNSVECSLEFVKCERVTEWPAGWQIVAILAGVVVAGWLVWRSR
jgi:hypothetical protein